MTRFNTKSVVPKTVNKAGGEAFSQKENLELVSILLTSFLKNDFYRSSNETAVRIKELILKETNKKFIAKAAIYARTKFGMRSVSHLVAGEIANSVKGESWTKTFFNKIVYRPDDMTEILSYLGHEYGKPFPNSLKKGFAMALGRFDEYSLAKYRMEGKDVSMVDVVNLVHPKSTPAIASLIKGELKSTDTWESRLSKAGQDAEDEDDLDILKGKAWLDLLSEGKLKYFALLRNLRNIIQQSPESVGLACKALVDEQAIKKSLVLPFRFLTAIKQIQEINEEGTRDVLIALNKATDIALSNVPKLDGKTLVVLDTSGSMGGRPIEIGSLFSSILIKSNNADYIHFAENAEYLTLNPTDSTLSIAQNILNKFGGGGTNFNSIFETANRAYDRIVILSDMQGWIGHHTPTEAFRAYKARTNADPKIYSFDLAGLGTLQFPEKNVYCMAGFSEKVFDIMKMLETDKDALVSEIEKIEL